MPKPPDNLEKILAAVAGGTVSPTAAAERLRSGEVRYLDEFAVLDLGRATRKGVPEIVYAPGKTPAQVAKICASILVRSERVIVSVPTPEQERLVRETLSGVPVRNAGKVLVAVPVVGLPTSTGYGLGGDGTAAILGMLQTCSPGLSVVNVDNATGAGVAGALVANRAASYRESHSTAD